MYAFQKFKNDDIISAKSSFYCFFIRTLWGVGGGRCKNGTFYMLVKVMKKMDDP